MISKLTNNGEFIKEATPAFNLIDNYIYIHHTDTLLIMPTFPPTLTDAMPISYSSTAILGRSAPIFTYNNSGPRSVDFNFQLHRDMMNQINIASGNYGNTYQNQSIIANDEATIRKLQRNDYVDLMISELQSIALPSYAVSEKMVNPPLVSVRIGDELFIKGIVEGSVSVHYDGPILANPVYDEEGNFVYEIDEFGNETSVKRVGKGKYALVDITFRVSEVDPYDAAIVAKMGSMRGLNRTLERNLYKVNI